MLKILAIFLMIFGLTACQSTNTGQRAAGGALIGGATGATIGAIAGGGRGAAIGAASGAAAGALIGAATTPGDCVYRDERGRRYVARCPK